MSITQLFFINMVIYFTTVIIDMIVLKGCTNKTIFSKWIYSYTNLTFISVPCFIIYGIIVLF